MMMGPPVSEKVDEVYRIWRERVDLMLPSLCKVALLDAVVLLVARALMVVVEHDHRGVRGQAGSEQTLPLICQAIIPQCGLLSKREVALPGAGSTAVRGTGIGALVASR